MTKSTITREQVIALIAEHSYDSALVDALEHLLATMNSEPVAFTEKHEISNMHATGIYLRAWPADRARNAVEGYTIPLYLHAQPAPVVPEEATPDSIEILASARRRDHAVFQWDEDQRNAAADSWNAFRAAMLQELKKSAGTEAICRSDENVQVLHTKSPAQSDCCPAQSDCCPAQNVVVPAQSPIDHGYLPECECSGCKATARICTEMAVNSLVIPNEMTSEQAYEIGYYYGDPVNVFARGANWMRQHIIDSTLAAAPQLPGSDPATVPGKWIPVSEQMPEVGDIVLTAMGGVVNVGETECSAANCRFFTSVISGRELPATHWMPLPAAPQEVK
ncbi:Eaa1 [Klebsiella pneumoniae]|nr:Eaa1 [Klebsiella pneumoniae]